MRKLYKELHSVFQNMNKISKIACKYGLIPIILIYLLAAFFYISAGRLVDYYTATQLSSSLLEIGKECLGAVYITALIIEILDISTGKEKEHANNK